MTHEREYGPAVPPRIRLYSCLLGAVLVLLDLAVLVAFAFSDRIAGLLPKSTAFLVVFGCTTFALLIWLSMVTGQWPAERAVYIRAFRRFAAWLRSRWRSG